MTRSENGKHIGAPTVADLDDPAVVDQLLDRIPAGRGILEVCRDPDMPNDSTVWRRIHRDAGFAARIARARETQQDVLIERTQEIADAATPADWQVARLRVATRQWAAA